MNNLVFGVLLAVGCTGILVSFVLARRRGVFAQDGFAEPSRRSAAVILLGAVLLLTVAIPFAGGLAGNRADTKNLTVVSLFLVHFILIGFLAFYYLLSGHRSVPEFLKLRSRRPAADLSAGLLIGLAGWLLTIVALVAIVFLWFVLKRQGIRTSKAELVEMLLWELPVRPSDEFLKRMTRFRRQVPRERL